MSVFGPIITGNDVEQATIETLKLWLPTYLQEMERRNSLDPGSLPTIGFWDTINAFPGTDEVQPPAGFVVSPGLADKPEQHGDGRIDAWWRIGVAVVISAGERRATNELAKLYGAALFTLLAQRSSLGGFASSVELVSLAYDDVPTDYLPVGATAQIECDVLVAAIANAWEGPSEPATGPGDVPPDPVTVTAAELDIQARSLT